MGKRRVGTLFGESLIKNNLAYNIYYERLKAIAISVFEWEGLPESVNKWYLERTITEKGSALVFEDEILMNPDAEDKGGIFGLPWTQKGKYDKYMFPLKRQAYANNGYRINRNKSNSVIVYDNVLKSSIIPGIRYYADRLYNMDRVVDVNVNAQKTPVLIKCSESQKLTLLNAYKEYDGNQPFIFASDDFNQENFTTLNTGAPYVAEQIHELKSRIWNEALTFIGVSNVSVQKKERLIRDEVQQEQGGTIASRYTRLITRKEACEKMNRLWADYLGNEIEVRFRKFSDTDLDLPGNETYEGEYEAEQEGGEQING